MQIADGMNDFKEIQNIFIEGNLKDKEFLMNLIEILETNDSYDLLI